jgi:hypothetical protein
MQIHKVQAAAAADKAARAAQAAAAVAAPAEAVTMASAARSADPLTFVRPVPKSDPFRAPPGGDAPDGAIEPAESSSLASPAAVGVSAMPGAPTAGLTAVPGLSGINQTRAANGATPTAMAQAAQPTWIVTGVLGTGSDRIAILRNGDERRYVRKGDMLDGDYRVARVTGDAVRIAHGADVQTLQLGVGAATDSSVAVGQSSGPPVSSNKADNQPDYGPTSGDSGPPATDTGQSDPFADTKTDSTDL